MRERRKAEVRLHIETLLAAGDGERRGGGGGEKGQTEIDGGRGGGAKGKTKEK